MEVERILHSLASISYVPISYYANDQEALFYPDLPFQKILSGKVPESLLTSSKAIDCVLTKQSLCFGVIKIRNSSAYAVFGPVSEIPCDNPRAQDILRSFGLSTTQTSDLLSYFSNTPYFSLPKFANLLTFANFIINGKDINPLDIMPDEYRPKDTDQPSSSHEIQHNLKKEEIPGLHNGQDYETELYSYVEHGNNSKLKQFVNTSVYMGNTGLVATNMLRQYKNLIISSSAIAARSAVKGGLDYETAMRQADWYIQKAEECGDLKSLSAVHFDMLKTLTRLVAERKLGNPNSAIAAKVYRYVENNINTRIHAEEIASALGISRSYLCIQFKKETGKNLNDFVNEIKIEEAKRLLRTTDFNAVQISTILDFSSQSYFQTVFKKYTGTTPKQFRENT